MPIIDMGNAPDPLRVEVLKMRRAANQKAWRTRKRMAAARAEMSRDARDEATPRDR